MIRKISFPIISIILLTTILSLTACAKKKMGEKVVATINDYRMTVDDFNYESKEVLDIGKTLGDFPVTKEDVLDALIEKELLIQEAQKENLNKDKDFMKTIELYWEQTLIKNLLEKKSKEITRRIAVYEDEVIDYYDTMKTRIRASIFVFADEKSARALLNYAGDVSRHLQTEQKERSLLYSIPSRWYILGEESRSLEGIIFNKTAKERELANIDGMWALVVVEERAPFELKPLTEMKDEIVRRIRSRKEEAFMDEWIEGLRSEARIKINKKVFGELK